MNTLQEGDQVPEFSGKDQDGKVHRLSDYKGKKLLIFFYPRANTPGCTAEACDIRDHYSEFREKGYEVLGVSADTEKKQRNFRDKYKLPYPLIADTEHKILNIFGVWGEKKFMGRTYDGIHRKTFLLDEEGKIVKRIDKVKTRNHSSQLL